MLPGHKTTNSNLFYSGRALQVSQTSFSWSILALVYALTVFFSSAQSFSETIGWVLLLTLSKTHVVDDVTTSLFTLCLTTASKRYFYPSKMMFISSYCSFGSLTIPLGLGVAVCTTYWQSCTARYTCSLFLMSIYTISSSLNFEPQASFKPSSFFGSDKLVVEVRTLYPPSSMKLLTTWFPT